MLSGLVAGFGLGSFARAWMRFISDDPEFTWTGTIFIILGFTVFGGSQAIVVATRRWNAQRPTLTAVRVIAALAMLPLFAAAGAVMFPTVIGGTLALSRVDWRVTTRCLFLLPAAGPVAFVGADLVNSFGWSAHMLAGFAAMLAIYGAIVWASRATFAPQLDNWRLVKGRREATRAAPEGAALTRRSSSWRSSRLRHKRR